MAANNVISENSEVSELIVRANDDFGSLTPAELIRLQFVFYNHFNQWLYAYESQERSLMEEPMWRGIIRGYCSLAASSSAFREMWKICGPVYQDSFRNHVDEALKQVEGQAPS